MLTPLPASIRQSWGEAASHDFASWLEGVMAGEAGHATAVEDRLDKVEVRLDKVEVRLGGVETRLAMVEHDLGELKAEVRDFRRSVEERFDRLQEQLVNQSRWSLGLVAAIGTVIAVLLGIGQLR